MRAILVLTALFTATALAAAGPDRDAATAKVAEARTMLSSGQAERALRLLREAVALDSGNAVAHNALGSMLNRDGRYAEALPHAEAAARLDPANMRYRYNRGVVLAEHGRFEEALADFDAALAAMPELTYGWLERGAVKLSLGDDAGARADWTRAAAADPKLIWPRWYQATGQFVAGDYAAAAAGFDAVAAAEPAFVPAKLWRVIAHGRSGKPIAPADPGSGEWPAAVLDRLRGQLSADELVRRVAEDRTTGDRRRLAEAHFFLAQQALIQGDRPVAAEQLRKALAIPTPRHSWRIAAERDLAALGG